ncbi:hypothetical protein NYE69_33275 [Paenibacillus sp. FSL R5-0527]|uniref:hypothetical protein n=1 Tax=Paenibacillus sp. FSL R5-0527 TaxID=2975321 RepID=UPI00097B8B4F|nr:hypothetical protein BK140_32925 [Paenibacillus macerans]
MPTGYTSSIYNGEEVTVKDFVLKCSRAFGALVMMRDEPMDAEIPVFEPSSYNLESLEKAKEQLKKLTSLSSEEVEKLAEEEYRNGVEEYQKNLKKRRELRSRYERLLAEVNAWNPPSSEHVGLKEFCVKQLEESIDWDCDEKYLTPPVRLSGEEYRKSGIVKAHKEIAYYSNAHEEEVQRTNSRNLWVKQLKDSLGEESK